MTFSKEMNHVVSTCEAVNFQRKDETRLPGLTVGSRVRATSRCRWREGTGPSKRRKTGNDAGIMVRFPNIVHISQHYEGNVSELNNVTFTYMYSKGNN